MDGDPTGTGGDRLADRILGLVRESRRLSLTDLRRRLEGDSLDGIVKSVNRLHQAHLVRLEMVHDDYEIVYVDPAS